MVGHPTYDAKSGVWNDSFQEKVPIGAPMYLYNFGINLQSGDRLFVSTNVFPLSHLRGRGKYSVHPSNTNPSGISPFSTVASEAGIVENILNGACFQVDDHYIDSIFLHPLIALCKVIIERDGGCIIFKRIGFIAIPDL